MQKELLDSKLDKNLPSGGNSTNQMETTRKVQIAPSFTRDNSNVLSSSDSSKGQSMKFYYITIRLLTIA